VIIKHSGAGTNLKVARNAIKNFSRTPPLFGTKSTGISRFVGQYSLVSFLFAVLLLTATLCALICKIGGARALVPRGVGVTDQTSL